MGRGGTQQCGTALLGCPLHRDPTAAALAVPAEPAPSHTLTLSALSPPFASLQYTFFSAILYIVISLLFLALALCARIGYSFQNNRFDLVW